MATNGQNSILSPVDVFRHGLQFEMGEQIISFANKAMRNAAFNINGTGNIVHEVALIEGRQHAEAMAIHLMNQIGIPPPLPPTPIGPAGNAEPATNAPANPPITIPTNVPAQSPAAPRPEILQFQLHEKITIPFFVQPVLAAFTTELYLKCLYLQDHGKPLRKKHELDEIFSLLQLDTKNRIRHYFGKYAEIKKHHLAAWCKEIGLNLSDFDVAIKISSQAFAKFRYVYEATGIEQWHGALILCAAREVNIERNPSWASLVPNSIRIIA